MSDHKCTTSEKIAAFSHTCEICGKEIEPVDCPECLGFGGHWESGASVPCERCNGSGVIKWQEAKQ